MINASFTEILLAGLAAILVVAAVIDVRTFTISNRLNLTVALLAPVYWASVALSPWPGIAIQLAAAITVFTILAGAFYAGMMGGGDVKLAAAVSLFAGPAQILDFVTVTAMVGGLLGVAILAGARIGPVASTAGCTVRARLRGHLPYGPAIAAGGLWVALALALT
jgi:prepilin peptidase CpaA